MTVDERALHELIVESEDLQVDALRDMEGIRADLADGRADRLRNGVDPDEAHEFAENRRRLLADDGFGLSTLAAVGGLGTAFAAAMTTMFGAPAGAQGSGDDVDVMVLQTASSLENLAVATYDAALGLDFIKDGNPVVKKFAQTTMKQHQEHGDAFKGATKTLGGEEQTEPNPKYLKVVNDAKPGLKDPAAVVELAMALEQVATQTYVANLSLLNDTTSKELMASVMGVESQHLATLRAVNALLAGGGADLIAIPTDLAKLPAAAGSVAFPEPFEGTEKASPPEEGAVQ
ncbi:MAG TPA: ferritin-like domain-containing protein [Acidimicrobiales bacterium]|jgi:rubrerythrin|nr:ferritin-like domain-containing protein [Acidimicrobiales bacterium]